MRTKTWSLLFSFLVSFSTMSGEYPNLEHGKVIGGTVYNVKSGSSLRLNCLEGGVETPELICARAQSELREEGKVYYGPEFSLHRYEVNARAHEAAKKRKDGLKETYIGIGFAGTGLSLFGGVLSGERGGDLLYVVAIGAIIDLAKSPFVVLGYFGQKYFSKRKVRHAVHHLASPAQSGTFYNVKNGAFEALKKEFFPHLFNKTDAVLE